MIPWQRLDGLAVAVLWWLCGAMSESGEAFVAKGTIADAFGVDPSTIRNRMAVLRDLGYLEDTGRRVGRRRNVTVWRVLAVPGIPTGDSYRGSVPGIRTGDDHAHRSPVIEEEGDPLEGGRPDEPDWPPVVARPRRKPAVREGPW